MENNELLKKRYLIWLYKTTKESLDRIDRKFTQLDIDYRFLRDFKKAIKRYPGIEKNIREFDIYIKNKEKEAFLEKFEESSKKINTNYIFLQLKISAVEKEITNIFGKKILKEIKKLYEEEMINRILSERMHR
ncbi:MAG: hypothetical protein AB1755_06295 [Candidatus Omnitrophota bacterium]